MCLDLCWLRVLFTVCCDDVFLLVGCGCLIVVCLVDSFSCCIVAVCFLFCFRFMSGLMCVRVLLLCCACVLVFVFLRAVCARVVCVVLFFVYVFPCVVRAVFLILFVVCVPLCVCLSCARFFCEA